MFPARQRDERRQKQRDDSVKQPPLRASVQLQLNERRSDRPAVWLSIWLSGYMAIWQSDGLATQSDARRCTLQHREYHEKFGKMLTHACMMHWRNMRTVKTGGRMRGGEGEGASGEAR